MSEGRREPRETEATREESHEEARDGYFTRTPSVPKFLRRLAGVKSRDERDY